MYTDFLNPFIALSKYGMDLLHNCGIIPGAVHFCEKGFFRESTVQEIEVQLGAHSGTTEVLTEARGWVCNRKSGRSEGVDLLLHFH